MVDQGLTLANLTVGVLSIGGLGTWYCLVPTSMYFFLLDTERISIHKFVKEYVMTYSQSTVSGMSYIFYFFATDHLTVHTLYTQKWMLLIIHDNYRDLSDII